MRLFKNNRGETDLFELLIILLVILPVFAGIFGLASDDEDKTIDGNVEVVVEEKAEARPNIDERIDAVINKVQEATKAVSEMDTTEIKENASTIATKIVIKAEQLKERISAPHNERESEEIEPEPEAPTPVVPADNQFTISDEFEDR